MERIHDYYRPVEERKGDFREVERALTPEELRPQVERCQDCGLPFCHGFGCPLGNLVPDQNRAVAAGDLKRAYELLSTNSDFPEFTARICPALCESCCVRQLDEEAVMIRQSEKLIIETAFRNGWVVPRPPQAENGRRVAVIGAGPAGLSAAVTLRRRGYAVTVYEQNAKIGGLLRYGIPAFKLDKAIIDRRQQILEAEGIRFVVNTTVGVDVSAAYLAKTHDAVVVAIGTPAARDLKIPGRELKGIHLALELLGQQNQALGGEIPANPIDCRGKRVLVIGGGDTGSDCVGTATRHGAASVTQIEIMPRPPDARSESTPWPLWPYLLRTSSSHLEGCERRWNLNSLRFVGDGTVRGVEVETVKWEFSPEGRPLAFKAVPGTKETIPADLVLLAMGFTGVPTDHPIVRELGLAQTPRTALVSDPARNIHCVGDCANGASLVVRAIADGKKVPL
ncbi:MAG: glutamate synthase subunit beta [Kiritimatiellia bacterium]